MMRQKISLILNIVTAVFVGYAWSQMLLRSSGNGTLSAVGLWSLRYFTVLSNLLAGLVSVVYAIIALVTWLITLMLWRINRALEGQICE